MMDIDTAGNSYEKVDLPNGEAVRVTYVADSWHDGPGIRLQIQQDDGHLRQGPEIPIRNVRDVIRVVERLLDQSAQR